MPTAFKKSATYEDLRALPPELTGQLIDGDLYAMPRPAVPHASVTSTLGMDLGGPFQRGRGGPGGWWIFDEPELHPEGRNLEAFELKQDGSWSLLGTWSEEERPRVAPFDAIELELSALWSTAE